MNLYKTHYLNRAGRYTSPKNSNDRLPIIYGDLTDGVSGNWKLPCINTVSNVYCFAAHETLSVVNGNTVSIYSNGVLVTASDYTFNHANNYESVGLISTITFSVPPTQNAVITASGKGKPSVSGSSTLMTNIIDIIEDYLVVESVSAQLNDFHATSKSASSLKFDNAGYLAAGIIEGDNAIQKTLSDMGGSFNLDIWVNNEQKLKIVLNDGTFVLTELADHISSGDVEFVQAKLQRDNIVNRIPISYQYDFAKNQFSSHSDVSSEADSSSIYLYGARTLDAPYPFYWCRDLQSCKAVRDSILNTQKTQNKVWEITFRDNSLKRSHVEVGDIIALTFDMLYDEKGSPLINQYLKILDINYDFNKDSITFRALNTGYYLTRQRKYDGSWKYDGSGTYGSERDANKY